MSLLVRLGLLWISVSTILDVLFTIAGLEAGVIREGNPLMKQVFDWSPAAAIAIKTVAAVGSYVVLFRLYPRRPRLITGGVLFLSVVMAGIISLHVYWLVALT